MADQGSFHFISDPAVLDIINSILELAGPNFAPPHSGESQPYDGVSGNRDTLLRFQLPGGSEMNGYAEPSNFGSIGTAINTLLAAFSPAFSAYAFILPILGVIRGIIEIICAMMNPFAIIAAVIRLFVKWIPPFLSLFPPFAGVTLIVSVIKVIIAIIFYILTVIVPTVQLIVDSFNRLSEVFGNDFPLDIKQEQIQAIEDRVISIVATLVQKIGLLGVLMPLLELVFLILRLIAGFPCGNDSNSDTGLSDFGQNAGLDSTCCDEFCPEILSSRAAQPSGIGVIVPSFYGECAPGFVFQLITTNPAVNTLGAFQESFQAQLSCLLDEPIDHARPPGAIADRSLIKVKLTSRRGPNRSVTVPVLSIRDGRVKMSSPLVFLFNGAVDYVLIPDYDMLIMNNMIGVGCHPDVRAVKDEIQDRFAGIDTPVVERFPETASLLDDMNNLNNNLNNLVSVDLQSCITSAFSKTLPPLTEDIACVNNVQGNIIDILNNSLGDLTGKLNGILDKMLDTSRSSLEVDKNTVNADAKDFATITVTPKDITGVSILRNLPEGVGLNVEIISNFGTISNIQTNNSNGTVTADIRSLTAGTANISAKINGELIVDRSITGTITTRVKQVRFVQEATLPARRKRSKPSMGKAINTGYDSNREPGKR